MARKFSLQYLNEKNKKLNKTNSPSASILSIDLYYFFINRITENKCIDSNPEKPIAEVTKIKSNESPWKLPYNPQTTKSLLSLKISHIPSDLQAVNYNIFRLRKT